jgi:endonuclease YncB( thermonuclease family)
MKKLIVFIVIVWWSCSPQYAPQPHETLQGKASYVIDGETFYFSYDRGKFKSRLYGIEAPGMTEKFGREAFEFLRKNIHQKNITIEYLGTDDEGRWVINANLENHENLQSLILKNGFAKAMVPEFKNLEASAQKEGAGIWRQLK